MIHPRLVLAPVVPQHRDVDVPAANGLLSVGHSVHRLRAQRQRRHPRRRRQALLRPAVADVDPPLVDQQLATGQGRDGVHQQQRAVGVDDARYLLQRLEDAGAGLPVDHGHELGARVGLERLLHLLRRDDSAPVRIDWHDLSPAAADHLRYPVAEEPVHTHDDRIARLDDVVDRRLHAGRAGAGDGDGHVVLGAEEGAQGPLGVVQELKELRVQIADDGRHHRPVDARVDVARAGAQQQPRRYVQLPEFVSHDEPPLSSTASIRSICFCAHRTASSKDAPRS